MNLQQRMIKEYWVNKHMNDAYKSKLATAIIGILLDSPYSAEQIAEYVTETCHNWENEWFTITYSEWHKEIEMYFE